MTSHSRRSVIAFAGLSGLGFRTLVAQGDHGHGNHHAHESCQTGLSTPIVVPYESDIPFDLAYIDSMIPHHASVVELSEAALDELEDERLIEIAQAVIDTQPAEMEQLMAFRDAWYPDEPEDVSDDRMHEMMMITMAAHESCGHDDHMYLMDGEWLVEEFNDAEDKDIHFIDLVIPHHEMAVRQSQVGIELAEHEELRQFCEEVVRVQSEEIELLKLVREELADD